MLGKEQDDDTVTFHEEAGTVIFDKPKNPEEANRQRRELEQHQFARAQVRTNRWLAVFTGVLTLATFCTIGVGLWQAKISQTAANAARDAVTVASNTLIETQRSNALQFANAEKARVDSNKAGADARRFAEKSLNSTIASDNLGERAWLGVTNAGPYGQPSSEVGFQVSMELTNSGKSPAYNLQTANGYRTTDTPIAGPSLADIAALRFHSADDALATQGKYRAVLGSPVQKGLLASPAETEGTKGLLAHFARIKANQEILYYFGVVKYDDIFGKTHFTHFCFYIPQENTGSVGYCDHFNDMN